ncbi:MAG: hypothetical protein ACUVSQ_11975, partial [Pseudanabaenaceae cyanobacterium]
MILQGFQNNGITITNSGSNIISGNFIGTNATGTGVVRNGRAPSGPTGPFDFGYGVYIEGTSTNNVIQNNVLSGNGLENILGQAEGVNLVGDNNVVRGNFVGTDA